MGMLALQRLMSLQRDRQSRSRQILAPIADGSIATVNKRKKDSPFKRVGHGDPQHSETMRDPIPHLPEEIWRHIHSLMPTRDAARAACLSRAFLSSWRSYPKLKLNLKTLCYKARGGNFCFRIDSILRNHSGTGLKILRLDLCDEGSTFPVDRWLQFAVTPGIEELTLGLYKKYNFPCSLLSRVRNSIRHLELDSCAFRPMAELGPLRSLTILRLSSVRITGDELECLLSNSLALEQLEIYDCKEIIFLKVPSVLQQLRYLDVTGCRKLKAIENNAPNLSSLFLYGKISNLLLGKASEMIKDLHMYRSNAVGYARAELPYTMPNLERLKLGSDVELDTPLLPSRFLYLKHLIIVIWNGTLSPSYDYFSLVSFLVASPSLETWFLDVSQEDMMYESVSGGSSHLRQLPEHRHDRLKSMEIVGFSSAKSLVELTRCIVKSAGSLESLKLDTLHGTRRCSDETDSDCPQICWPISKAVRDEASRAVTAIKGYIEAEVAPTAKLSVLEPCTRCHSTEGGSWAMYMYYRSWPISKAIAT